MDSTSTPLYPTSDGIIPDLGVSLEDLEMYVSHAREGQYLLMAGIALLLYDYFCTLDEEVSSVWGNAPYLVAGKILFALNRYLPIFTLIFRFVALNQSMYDVRVSFFVPTVDRRRSEMNRIANKVIPGVSANLYIESESLSSTHQSLPFSCNTALLSATGFSGMANVAIVEVVLLLRVWVIYARDKWIGIALWSFCLVCIGFAFAVKYLPFVSPPTYETSCSKIVPIEMFLIYGVVTLAETVFFAMLLYKAYQMYRNSSDTPILTALIKQGTLYFFIVLATLAFTMLAPFSDKLFWPVANAFPIVPIVSVACNRLILSLRGMVFSENATRSSGFGMSGSRSQDHSSTALNAARPTTAVTFTGDRRDQDNHHRSGDTLVTLEVHSVDDQRRQQGGGSGMDESWSSMEEGDNNASVHPMLPIRRG